MLIKFESNKLNFIDNQDNFIGCSAPHYLDILIIENNSKIFYERCDKPFLEELAGYLIDFDSVRQGDYGGELFFNITNGDSVLNVEISNCDQYYTSRYSVVKDNVEIEKSEF